MPIWEAILLGVVQGLTEFLPISSTAHLLLVRTLLGHPAPEDAFTTVIQLGTLVAVVVYFRWDIAALARGFLTDMVELKIGSTAAGRMAWLIILGTVPVVVIGLTLKKWLKETFFNPGAIGVVAIVFALLMAASEWWARRRAAAGEPARGEWDVTWKDAVWVGLWQALALMPGGSRSGTTITAGLFAGLSRPAAAKFSFLLSLPAVFAAGVKEFYDERRTIVASGDQAAALLVGLVVSAAVGYLAIAFLIGYLKTHTTAGFVIYRIVLGVAILGMVAGGLLPKRTADRPVPPDAQLGRDGTGWVPARGRVVLPESRPIPQKPAAELGSLLADDIVVNPTDRGVKNAVVWLSPDADDPAAPFPDRWLAPGQANHLPTEYTVTVEPTRFKPRVTAVRAGDVLAFGGGGLTPILSGARNGQWSPAADAKPPARTPPLRWEADPLPLRAAESPWVRGWVWVFDHPYFAVTDDHGGFELKDAPTGRFVLNVWHEAGGRAARRVEVRAGAEWAPVELDVGR